MALPSSGEIDLKEIYTEYYKTFVPTSNLSLQSMSILYGETTKPYGMDEFYNKYVVKTFFSVVSDTGPGTNNRTAILSPNLTGQTTGTSNLSISYEMYLDYDGGGIGESYIILEYTKNGSIWFPLDQIDIYGSGTNLKSNAHIISSISVAESTQTKFRCTAWRTSGMWDYHFTVDIIGMVLSSTDGIHNSGNPALFIIQDNDLA